MTGLRHSPLRLIIVLAVVALGLIEIQNLSLAIRAQDRFRNRVVNGVHEAVVAERSRIAADLRSGPPDWFRLLERALHSCPAAEAEVLDLNGRRLLVRPAPVPVEHWPTPREMTDLRRGEVRTFGPLVGTSSRLLSYAAFDVAGRTYLIRLASPAPDLVEEMHERRSLFLTHGIALIVLIVVAGLAMAPVREASSIGGGDALGAYSEAIERLRQHSQALGAQHAQALERMEAQVKDKEAMARAGELTSGIVHEIRNGLGTILGYARLIEREKAAPVVTETAQGIRQECETLESVVRRFLEYVRRETLNLHAFDLGRMLARVVARETHGRSAVEVALPESGQEMVGDEELLERAFENLIRNGLEAAGPGGHVQVAAESHPDAIMVTIADDGPGLPLDFGATPRPFQTTKPGGLGLGLPMAMKIVALHRGELSLSNRLPRGLNVVVRLPRPPDGFGYDS